MQSFEKVRLFYASAAGDPVNVKSLLEEKADVNYKDHNARTALHSAPGLKRSTTIGQQTKSGLCREVCAV